jgi:hypothetical protein
MCMTCTNINVIAAMMITFAQSWEPRERRPRFWGGAGEARADQNEVARRRIQYAMNFFKTDLLTY